MTLALKGKYEYNLMCEKIYAVLNDYQYMAAALLRTPPNVFPIFLLWIWLDVYVNEMSLLWHVLQEKYIGNSSEKTFESISRMQNDYRTWDYPISSFVFYP